MQPVESSGVRYAKSGTVDVAYEIVGAGPVDIVYVPGFISHLDLYREIPSFFTVIERMARRARVLVFDKRGTGLSSRVGFGSIADRVDDIRAVMDHAGWDRANFFGVSEGGPLSVLFAASYPSRVAKLALFGTFAALDPAAAGIDFDRYLAWLERSWGSGKVIAQFLGRSKDASIADLLARYERGATSPQVAAEIMRANLSIDVAPLLPTVAAPALVLHQHGDPIIAVKAGRDLAAALPDARFVEFEGDVHIPPGAREWLPILEEMESFFGTATPSGSEAERILATVMFTDIVDSTARASEVGDRKWRALLDAHDAEAARIVAAHAGRIVKQTGDGVLATFDGPARAVQCAQQLQGALGRVGLTIRAGLHTGEIERRGDDVGGIAVHIASRVVGQAGAGEVLVSRTVRDLVVGSDLQFEARGTHELKGIPDEWQLYAALEGPA
jgi:class 3 adenylate cyclase